MSDRQRASNTGNNVSNSENFDLRPPQNTNKTGNSDPHDPNNSGNFDAQPSHGANNHTHFNSHPSQNANDFQPNNSRNFDSQNQNNPRNLESQNANKPRNFDDHPSCGANNYNAEFNARPSQNPNDFGNYSTRYPNNFGQFNLHPSQNINDFENYPTRNPNNSEQFNQRPTRANNNCGNHNSRPYQNPNHNPNRDFNYQQNRANMDGWDENDDWQPNNNYYDNQNNNQRQQVNPCRNIFLRRLQTLPAFSGESRQKLRDFIDIAGALYESSTSAVEQHEVIEQINLQLRGQARNVLGVNRQNWNVIKHELLSEFAYLNSREIINSKLENLKQKTDESMVDYVDRARKLLQEKNCSYIVLHGDQREEHDRMAKRAFIRGISEPKLRDRMITRGATSLQDAIAHAVETEYEGVSYVPNSELYCRYCKKNGHRERDCHAKNREKSI